MKKNKAVEKVDVSKMTRQEAVEEGLKLLGYVGRKGRKTKYSEPLGISITVRFPISIEKKLGKMKGLMIRDIVVAHFDNNRGEKEK